MKTRFVDEAIAALGGAKRSWSQSHCRTALGCTLSMVRRRPDRAPSSQQRRATALRRQGGEKLHSRDWGTHFESGKTGQSTLRWTLASLLRMRPQYRNLEKPERPASYGLHPDDEATLTDCMRSHLAIAVWEKPAQCESLAAVEIEIISKLKPPLNLKDNASPWRDQVSKARREMAARLRGLTS